MWRNAWAIFVLYSDYAYKLREVVVSDKIFKDLGQYLFSANS
jgi:hypothetical protein